MVDVISTLKAPSFFGFLSIRTGLFIISFIQVLTGISIFFTLHYLRPGLITTHWFILTLFVLSAFLGIWGAWKRKQIVETIYFVTFVCCGAMLLLVAMDFSDVLHILPKPTQEVTSEFFFNVRHGLGGTYPSTSDVRLRKTSEHALLLKVLEHPAPESAGDKLGEIAENLPFVPHNETEGESEEVAQSELPPETKKLSSEGKDEVVVIAKMAKQPIKLVTGGAYALLFLVYMYFAWIVLTFVLNKCTSLDELTGQPEQFEPLVAGQ